MIPRRRSPLRRNGFPLSTLLFIGLLGVPLLGCGRASEAGNEEMEAAPQQVVPPTLGPTDGFDLPATDLERVAVGTMAPDFSLEAISGETLTLSGFRGAKNVVLVFYRGHW